MRQSDWVFRAIHWMAWRRWWRVLFQGRFFADAGERDRVYTPWVTFIAFLGQSLSRGSACREAVRRVQAWRVASKRSVPDESTSGYCQARARLPLEILRAAYEQIGERICHHTQEAWCDRSVKVLDGCGISMPDTEENRARWPYAFCSRFVEAHEIRRAARLERFSSPTG